MKIDTRVTLALILALLLQFAAAFNWAGRASDRLDQLEQRLILQQPVAERLARLEVRADEAHAALDRIERRLDTKRR